MYPFGEKIDENAFKRLKKFAPYTEDVRILLNAAEKTKRHILAEQKDEATDIEKEFNYLLADSIRLSYIRRFFEPILKEPDFDFSALRTLFLDVFREK